MSSTTARENGPVEQAIEDLKPRLRGMLHLGMAPLALAAGIVLVALAPSGAVRLAATVFATTGFLLFANSALYHQWRWKPSVKPVLKRLDHAFIFLVIAGTYTPIAFLLPDGQRNTLLAVVWIGALLGVAFRVFWIHAPRWLYTPLYVLLGWVAVFFMAPLVRLGGWTTMSLVIAGGVLYTVGAVAYGLKRPNPWPRWYGFHEIFHTLTILAFACHYVAAFLVVRGHTPRGIIH